MMDRNFSEQGGKTIPNRSKDKGPERIREQQKHKGGGCMCGSKQLRNEGW